MLTITDPSILRNHAEYMRLNKSRLTDNRTITTLTTLPSAMKHPHAASLASTSTDPIHPIPKSEEKFHLFSNTLLKTKSLLVPRRLALKRQRPALKGSNQHIETVQSETLQMELGNPESLLVQWDVHDKDEADDQHRANRDHSDEPMPPLHSSCLNVSPELNDPHYVSQYISALPVSTSYTTPADIALLYKEKPVTAHPITGEVLHHYLEKNGSPSPCSYVLPRKSLREKNAPAYTFGNRCLVEKNGGSRTAWQKQWFAHSNPFTTKVDFNREIAWPTPGDYPAPSMMGTQPCKVTFPAWSIGTRLPNSSSLTTDPTPSPNTYDTLPAFQKLTTKSTPITLKSRPGGTQITMKSSTNIVPGPGAHDQQKFLSNKSSAPKYSFGKRLPVSLGQDPYVNTLPPVEA